MTIETRSFASETYQFGFNAQEKDTEIHAEIYHAEHWKYDSRVARRWNIDPVFVPFESPYATFRNNPILMVDPNGDTPVNTNGGGDNDGGNVSEAPEKGGLRVMLIINKKGTTDMEWHNVMLKKYGEYKEEHIIRATNEPDAIRKLKKYKGQPIERLMVLTHGGPGENGNYGIYTYEAILRFAKHRRDKLNEKSFQGLKGIALVNAYKTKYGNATVSDLRYKSGLVFTRTAKIILAGCQTHVDEGSKEWGRKNGLYRKHYHIGITHSVAEEISKIFKGVSVIASTILYRGEGNIPQDGRTMPGSGYDPPKSNRYRVGSKGSWWIITNGVAKPLIKGGGPFLDLLTEMPTNYAVPLKK